MKVSLKRLVIENDFIGLECCSVVSKRQIFLQVCEILMFFQTLQQNIYTSTQHITHLYGTSSELFKSLVLRFHVSSRFQKMPNGSLLITGVTTDDTGRYTCVAGNSCSIKDRVAQLYVVGE